MKKQLLGIILILASGFVNAQIYMYGTTSEGGANGKGTIYRVDENGNNYQTLFAFSDATGYEPYAGLTLANNGKLYGFTTKGGQIVNPGAVLAEGSFYEFDPLTNTFAVIEYLDDQSAIGELFYNSPILGSDGLLYFMSTSVNLGEDKSVLSTYNPANSTLSVLAITDLNDFCNSKLLQANDGNIYFTTRQSGITKIMRYNTVSNIFENVYNSTGITDFNVALNNPLFQASDNMLYGCTRQGGTFQNGILFRIALDGSGFTILHTFDGYVQGQGWVPAGGFVEKNGFLYSTTTQEDDLNVNSGVIYKVELSTGIYSVVHVLVDNIEGARPQGTFIESNGRLYITCNGGSTVNSSYLNDGSIIDFNTANGAVTKKHSFGASGKHPFYNELCLVDFSALSIDESSLLSNIVKTYPNPVKDFVQIKTEGTYNIETIKILNMTGSELFIDNFKSNECKVNTSFLSSGVYLLYIQTNSGSTTRKIIKE
ncbi:T9SS C-terminal target domain-containing protein [Lutibacter sp. HS1-25]|uniref:choice-of-anchor tandem repeat GloVer-containing protein n=1 Tax=Lutibacter sp. HS1-25 TaxID=2485000 RepID=UPI001010500B|nr:choice-of-anchor tandem repeat GloVer-containing protein [Lutibacter sp. HS1-25]RXP52465.1 T9SS C-terminal target domain-containing protein [Lutibacter sp. HS1-25]